MDLNTSTRFRIMKQDLNTRTDFCSISGSLDFRNRYASFQGPGLIVCGIKITLLYCERHSLEAAVERAVGLLDAAAVLRKLTVGTFHE